jgi:hypothetical protein
LRVHRPTPLLMYIERMPVSTFIDPRTNPVRSVPTASARTTAEPEALTELHRLCRDGRVYEIEHLIQAGRAVSGKFRSCTGDPSRPRWAIRSSLVRAGRETSERLGTVRSRFGEGVWTSSDPCTAEGILGQDPARSENARRPRLVELQAGEAEVIIIRTPQ